MTKVDTITKKKRIESTFRLDKERQALITEMNTILADLSEDADMPKRVYDINERLKSIEGAMSANATLLATWLSESIEDEL